MAIELEEYNEMLADLKENKSVCTKNAETLEYEMVFVSALVEENKNDRALLRLKVKVNDRYFVNQEMINVLNLTIKYLKAEKEFDGVFNQYMDRYDDLAKRFISISKDADFIELANKYMPNTAEKGNNL